MSDEAKPQRPYFELDDIVAEAESGSYEPHEPALVREIWKMAE